jgi:hypothetical protein
VDRGRSRSGHGARARGGAGKQFYAVNVKTRLALSPGDLETQKLRYSLDYDCKDCKTPN